jgi:hypothetical protein
MHGARFPFYFQGNQALLDFQGVERQKLILAHNNLEVLREDLRNVLSYLVVLHKPQPDIFPCCTGENSFSLCCFAPGSGKSSNVMCLHLITSTVMMYIEHVDIQGWKIAIFLVDLCVLLCIDLSGRK